MPAPTEIAVSVIGIDIGKNSFHIVGLDQRGAIVLRQKWSRGQVDVRLTNMPPCLIGMEACVGAHHLSRKLRALGHDARLMPAKYVRPYCKGQKNDFRDAEAIAERGEQRHQAVDGKVDMPDLADVVEHLAQGEGHRFEDACEARPMPGQHLREQRVRMQR